MDESVKKAIEIKRKETQVKKDVVRRIDFLVPSKLRFVYKRFRQLRIVLTRHVLKSH